MKKFTLMCQNCNAKFIANTTNTKYCDNCFEDRLCMNCGNDIGRRVFCNTFCQLQWKAKENIKSGNCTICQSYSETRDSTGRCSKCVTKQVSDSWENGTLDTKINRLKRLGLYQHF